MTKQRVINGYDRINGIMDGRSENQYLGINFNGEHYILDLPTSEEPEIIQLFRLVKYDEAKHRATVVEVEDRGLANKLWRMMNKNPLNLDVKSK